MESRRSLTEPPELWGGIECTVNRVRDTYQNQLALSGHLNRPADLELIAGLGLKTLRYPVLWELVAPNTPEETDWSWCDERLARLRELGIAPIAGLLHHGSGPAYTSLLDAGFPDKLARYAAQVARRYPWISAYTPINEPLTTARFSALYGHWYPHAADDLSFVRALLLQCRAIARAMRAIRQVNPQARLVATEDLGCTFATGRLRYQAEFENHRRWLSYDLLCGRVNDQHPLRWWLELHGASPAELDEFCERPSPPDVIGVNYYLTSDRFLDHRLERYPEWVRGGNGRDRYADVEAVRVRPEGIVGHEEHLREAWARYGRSLAITEVHLGSSREEQLRWLNEAWQAALALRRQGVALEAVTSWALLGSFDWDSLFTRQTGCYEPGAFDIRGPRPRRTAIGAALRELSQTGGLSDPCLGTPGWWRRPERFLPECRPAGWRPRHFDGEAACGVLITGKTGTLGQAFARLCQQRGIHYRLLCRQELDIASPESVAAALERFRPWAVVNGAGFVRIDQAESDRENCFRENTTGPALLAGECGKRGIALLTFSSDMVFNGKKGTAYYENDPVAPLNTYGHSKAEAERRVLALHPQALVVRTSAFFGPWDDYNFVTTTLRELRRGEGVPAACDLYVSPTYVPDLVSASLDLLLDRERGIWHLSNLGAVSWAEFARRFAALAGLDPAGVLPRPAASFGFPALRPSFVPLATVRGGSLPELDDALERYFRDAALPRLP
ncbi:hypothetical protein GMST_25090 [Geomonas silvestris]|uniref:dTDP-4-dehydrorhamnose reductase n=1 Tax=Geomonas silvestris TaxID=2740184 RepID=A0A6V8MJR9_9BACT|nr:family 1 glycosylhydrolase [Geomonas silvestris]GFO60184.1 hypothetical protein GMST_25090 [Geomonas silvestris]